MMHSDRGSIHIVLLFMLVGTLALFAVVYIQKTRAPLLSVLPLTPYQNTTLGYSIKLPATWAVCESAESASAVRLGNNSLCSAKPASSFVVIPVNLLAHIANKSPAETFENWVIRAEKSDFGSSTFITTTKHYRYNATKEAVLANRVYQADSYYKSNRYQQVLYIQLDKENTLLLIGEVQGTIADTENDNLKQFIDKARPIAITTGDIIGKVRKEAEGKNIAFPYAQISLIASDGKSVIKQVTADKNGTFLLHLPPQRVIIPTIEKIATSVTIISGKQREVSITLPPTGQRLHSENAGINEEEFLSEISAPSTPF